MNPVFRSMLRTAMAKAGIEVRRVGGAHPFKAGSTTRPIGKVGEFLEDIRARGFFPKGIIDVGANAGDWSRLALSIFPEAPLIMIEPQKEMESCLRRFSNARVNCHYVKAGAGREVGEEVQTIWPDFAGSSFLPEADEKKIQAGKQRKTSVITIDKLLAEIYPDFVPDLVKLDIQGYELEALKGAKSIFGRTELFIVETSLFEFLPRQPITREVISFMSSRGYELYDITEFLRRPSDGALGQIDLAFARSNGWFRSSAAW